jgi:hypothetical protein
MPEIKWHVMQVKKKNIDKYVRKKLMGYVLRKGVHIDISQDAKTILRERRDEFTDRTLQLIVAFGDERLIRIVLQRLPPPLLQQLAISENYAVLDDLNDKEQFIKLIPTILIHHTDKDDFDARIAGKIIESCAPQSFEQYKNDDRLQGTVLTHKHCPLPIFFELITKHPKLVHSWGVETYLAKYISEGRLKVVLADGNKT